MAHLRITGQEKVQREMGIETLYTGITTEYFPNLKKDINSQVQEDYRTQSRFNPKKITSRHLVIKLQKVKDKERILKAA